MFERPFSKIADERQNMPIANVVSICVTGYLGEGRSISDQEVEEGVQVMGPIRPTLSKKPGMATFRPVRPARPMQASLILKFFS